MERINLMVEDGVAELMTQLAAGERRRGQWLSTLVRSLHEMEQAGQDGTLESHSYQLRGLAGEVHLIKGAIAHLQRRLEEMAEVVARNNGR